MERSAYLIKLPETDIRIVGTLQNAFDLANKLNNDIEAIVCIEDFREKLLHFRIDLKGEFVWLSMSESIARSIAAKAEHP